jgi:NCAIR mutase (PurE)-related protein
MLSVVVEEVVEVVVVAVDHQLGYGRKRLSIQLLLAMALLLQPHLLVLIHHL